MAMGAGVGRGLHIRSGNVIPTCRFLSPTNPIRRSRASPARASSFGDGTIPRFSGFFVARLRSERSPAFPKSQPRNSPPSSGWRGPLLRRRKTRRPERHRPRAVRAPPCFNNWARGASPTKPRAPTESIEVGASVPPRRLKIAVARGTRRNLRLHTASPSSSPVRIRATFSTSRT